tara:strand:- start:998 stop:1177 length:180 start_codon:yes stop_codon:yes gene_type:complete
MDKEKKSELLKTLGWSGITCFGGLGAFRNADVGDQFAAAAIFFVIIYFVFRVFRIFNIV